MTSSREPIVVLSIIVGVIAALIFAGVLVALLVFTVRYRDPRRGTAPQIHGHRTLEILWTAIPALILAFIAFPTVQTIFRTQAKAKADALQVEVIGHQWWWEFRYPQFTMRSPTGKLDTVVTANELYLPKGRTVNFTLKSQDVIHSFWVPALAGKRDLIANHTNYLWFTPDSAGTTAYNGFCVEYCGASHANMRFRTFVVTPDEFQSWIAYQATPAAFVLPTRGQAVAHNAAAAPTRPCWSAPRATVWPPPTA